MNRLTKICMAILIVALVIYFYLISEKTQELKKHILNMAFNKVDNRFGWIEVENVTILTPDRRFDKDHVFNILMWTDNKTVPFEYLKKGNVIFNEENCEFSNCFITKDANYLSDVTKFDVLLFHAPEFTYRPFKRYEKPNVRSPNQLYIFTCIESAHNYPVCSNDYNSFFNWTWTYKTTSEAKWGYVDIKDMDDNIIGPKANMEWIEEMDDVTQETLDILKGKTKAVAWLVSNCFTKSRRESYTKDLEVHLQEFNLTMDVYGRCGTAKCGTTEECHALFKNDYHFYLSFENSIAEDYVTEKFLHAIKNYAIPIVWGGGDYSRFAPPHSYLNAKEIDALHMAKIINDLINNTTEFVSYFKWRNHYKYQRDIETPDTRASCRLCKALNENYGISDGSNTKYKDFKSWWNAGIPGSC